jgi:hypothetical protein
MMMEFLSSYGLWIALGGVMIGMHWFGMGCCGGGHRRGADRRPTPVADESVKNGKSTGKEDGSGPTCH